MRTKKVILFIVEGISDKISLGGIVDRIIKDNDDEVRFLVTNGDITSDSSTTVQNAINKVGNHISRFRKETFLKKSDILRIVHMVDTDGAYIARKYIVKKEAGHLKYTTEHIYAKNVRFVYERNQKKRDIMNRLSCYQEISGIKYSIYYFSCNLEHVLHDELDMHDKYKLDKAEEFAERFYGKEYEFIDFISDPEFAVPGDYRQTWEFIKWGRHSLNRYCNFHLFFEKYKDAANR